jgi:hypothetical protein
MGEDAVEIKYFRKYSLAIAGLMGQGSELQENSYPKKIPIPIKEWGFMKKKEFGDDLLSHQVTLAVPSALRNLTSEIGTGSGVTSSLLPPKNKN